MAGPSWRPSHDSNRRSESYRPGGMDVNAAFDQYRPPPPSLGRGYDRRDDRNDSRRGDRREYYRDDNRTRDSQNMYQFRGDEYSAKEDARRARHSPIDSYRPGAPRSPTWGGDSYRPKSESMNFDFRYDAPQSLDYSRDSGSRHPQRLTNGGANGPQQYDSNRSNQRFRRGGTYSRGGYSRKAADRPFLMTQRVPTPERMAGMEDEEGESTKFRAVEDMSDSDEADMDVSSDDESGHSSADVAEQPKKKQVRADIRQAADGDSVPRWSNPDPYTALPPPDESLRKKKDVVKLIRKARVTKNADEIHKVEAVADDFISFDFHDDVNKHDHAMEETDYVADDQRAPLGPRYSHRDNIHSQIPSLVQPAANASGKSAVIQPYSHSQIPPLVQPAANALGKYAVTEPSSDPSLGNRKRTYNDEIKGPPPFVKKMVGGPASGKVVADWNPGKVANPVPWCINDHSRTVNMGDWLHKEIIDFYNHVRPQEFEHTIRQGLLSNLRSAVQNHYPDANIHSFGSFVAKLYLPTADMDLVMVSDQFMQGRMGKYANKGALYRFREFLQANKIAVPGSVEIIPSAKVPLVKYVDKLTGLKVDVSFENDSGIIANETFGQWKTEFPAMPILVTLIKQFLTMRGLNEPVNGGIGGFSIICLVVSMLQLMPQVQSNNMIPEHHLGEVLMEFFDLYGNEFNTMTTAIQLKPPAYLPKDVAKQIVYRLNDKMPKFTIIDPNNSSNDIAGGSSNTRTIIKVFSEAFDKLRQRLSELQRLPIEQRKGQSILGVILAGDYSSFDEQRDYLSYLHSLGP